MRVLERKFCQVYIIAIKLFSSPPDYTAAVAAHIVLPFYLREFCFSTFIAQIISRRTVVCVEDWVTEHKQTPAGAQEMICIGKENFLSKTSKESNKHKKQERVRSYKVFFYYS